jgi:hypothetical protein
MGTIFKAQHPTFGTKNSRQSLSYQQRSPYYWWWEFLRRNEKYLECCRNGGNGELSELYQSFGVVLNDNFKEWWTKDGRGFRLFAEEPQAQRMKKLNSPSEWNEKWTDDNVLVVVAPLSMTSKELKGTFSKMLKKWHKGVRGRKSLNDVGASTAKFPLHRYVSIHTLRKQLSVYDAVIANKSADKKLTLAQIGKKLKLVEDAMPLATDDKDTAEDKRNVMTSSVSRYYREASRIIANTAKGQFPNSDK